MEAWTAAIEEIEERLEGGIDMRAGAPGRASEHSFRRVFSALAGMPLSTHVRRRRMVVAAAAVVDGEEAVTRIAARFGDASGARRRRRPARHGRPDRTVLMGRFSPNRDVRG